MSHRRNKGRRTKNLAIAYAHMYLLCCRARAVAWCACCSLVRAPKAAGWGVKFGGRNAGRFSILLCFCSALDARTTSTQSPTHPHPPYPRQTDRQSAGTMSGLLGGLKFVGKVM